MYDAIFSGAGPSGSQYAERLAKTGYNVALFPSEDFLANIND